MELIPELVQAYAARYTTAESALLQQINLFTQHHHPHAHMLSGHEQGRFLALISKLKKPKKVLEIGTFTGYSALCLLEGLDKNGILHTIELRDEDARTAQGFFDQHPQGDQIRLHTGNALEIIPGMGNDWDLVFIDADKTAYIDYYEMILPGLSADGIILADNVLFHGQVLNTPATGKNAKAIQAFNEHVANDPRVEHLLLTMRDGIMLIWKK